VGRIGHLDLVRIERRWVLERGIMLLSRSTRWITVICVNCFGLEAWQPPGRQRVEITVTQTGPMSTRFEARVRP
jgi:hypothetical protein